MKHNLSKLRKLIEQNLTLDEIGAIFGVSGEAVRQFCKRHKIQRVKQTAKGCVKNLITYNKSDKARQKTIARNKSKRLELPLDRIREMYEKEFRSMMYIANYFQVSEKVIRLRLKELGVRMRDCNDHHYL